MTSICHPDISGKKIWPIPYTSFQPGLGLGLGLGQIQWNSFMFKTSQLLNRQKEMPLFIDAIKEHAHILCITISISSNHWDFYFWEAVFDLRIYIYGKKYYEITGLEPCPISSLADWDEFWVLGPKMWCQKLDKRCY